MKISASYKFISTLLSLSFILSFTVSLCSVSTMEEMCEQMMNHSSEDMFEMEHGASHKDMMQSNHTSDIAECDMDVDCDCISEKEVLGTIAPTILLKTSIPQTVFGEEVPKTNYRDSSKSKLEPRESNSYSPPPLFLANESFLI